MIKINACVLSLVLTAATMHAAPPVLRELSPRGAQRGKTFTLYLRGEGLTPSAHITSTLPADFSRLTLTKDPLAEASAVMTPGSALPFLVSLRADAAPGAYPIRVTAPDGISNVLLFNVSDLPEIEEIEKKDVKQSNDLPSGSQKLAVPRLSTGRWPELTLTSITTHSRPVLEKSWYSRWRRAGQAPRSIRQSNSSTLPAANWRKMTTRRESESIQGSSSRFPKPANIVCVYTIPSTARKRKISIA